MVRAVDRAAACVIAFGGQGVLFAMLAICVFLVATALPLFDAGGVSGTHAGGAVEQPDEVVLSVTDWGHVAVVSRTGVVVFGVEGERISRAEMPALDARVTTIGYGGGPGEAVLGLADGTLARLAFDFDRQLIDGVPAELARGALGVWHEIPSDVAARLGADPDGGVAFLLHKDADSWGLWTLRLTLGEPIPVAGVDGPIELVREMRSSPSSSTLVAGSESDYAIGRVRVTRRLDGGAGRTRVRWTPLDPPAGRFDRLMWIFPGPGGRSLFAVATTGASLWSAEDQAWRPFPSSDPPRRVSSAAVAPGGSSIVLGYEDGAVELWTLVARDDGPPDVALARSFAGADAPVTALATRPGGRTLSIGYGDGSVRLVHLTSGKVIAALRGEGEPVAMVAHAPRDHLLVAVAGGRMRAWSIDPGHPEASWSALFGRVLYEGYERPEWVYQSTGGDGVEAKLSLMPLIWGTLKATIVTMIIAIPLGVLAAVYSSEFVPAAWRRAVKPTIELMASLPSVVLGFIAAMVVAPFVRSHLSAVLLSAAVVPALVFLIASAWASLPAERLRRVPWAAQFTLVVLVLASGVAIAVAASPVVEQWLIGDVEGGVIGWLQGAGDRLWGGWFALLLPLGAAAYLLAGPCVRFARHDLEVRRGGRLVLAFGVWCGVCLLGGFAARAGVLGSLLFAVASAVTVAAALLVARAMSSPLERLAGNKATGGVRWANLPRGAVTLAVVVGIALAGAFAFAAADIDARPLLFGSFSQRNTLVVGVIMGFAVIPLIYTISEDALRAVPASLRAASLGAGATRWQTAVRVVLPVAGSGIFSACMIGLGRAVGETMIVLMATGSTPEMSVNIFSGFRSLAANIAIELPEAPQGGTHYRVLFLCGLVLFVLTLAVNTTAEVVRQRFRKRNAAL